MKKIIAAFSLLLCVIAFKSWGMDDKAVGILPECMENNSWIPNDTLPEKQNKTTKKKETTKTHADTTRYGVDKSSTVTGEAGSGSGVGDGGSSSAADTMTILK